MNKVQKHSLSNSFIQDNLVSTLASSSSSDELALVIGSSTSLNTIVQLEKGDSVRNDLGHNNKAFTLFGGLKSSNHPKLDSKEKLLCHRLLTNDLPLMSRKGPISC